MVVGHDAVEIAGNGAYVAVDGPLVIVEHDNQAVGLVGNVVQGFEGNSIGKGGVAGNRDHVLIAAGHIAGHSHAERRGERGSGMSGSIAVMLALGAQGEPVQPAGLPDGIELLAAAGEDLMGIDLVADIPDKPVLRRIEDIMQGQGQLHDPEIGAQMAACFGQCLDQEFTNLGGQIRQLCMTQALDVGRRLDGFQQCSHRCPLPG